MLHRPVQRASWRLRARRALEGGCFGAAVALALWIPLLPPAQTGWLEAALPGRVLPWLVVLPMLAALLAAVRRIDPLRMAVRLDRVNGLDTVYVNAWEVTQLPGAAQTDAMRLHLARHAQIADRVRVAPAVPWRMPRDLPPLLLLVAVAALLGPMRPAARPFVAWEPPPPVAQPRIVTADTAFERERLRDLRAQVAPLEDEALEQLLDQIEAAIDAIETRQDQRTVREQLAQIGQQIDAALAALREAQDPEEAAAIAEALAALQESLDGNRVTDAVAEALRRQDPGRASQYLDELAALTAADASDPNALSDQERDALRQALAAAAAAMDPTDPDTARRLAEAEAAVARQEARMTGRNADSAREQARLADLQQRLEALAAERDAAAAARTGQDALRQQLSEQLSRAAQALAEEADARAQDAAAAGSDASDIRSPTGDQAELRRQQEQQARERAADAIRDSSRTLRQLTREQQREQALQDAQQRNDAVRESAQRRGNAGGTDRQQARADAMRDLLDRAAGRDQRNPFGERAPQGQPEGGGQQGGGQQGGGQQGGGQQGGGQQGGGQQGGGQQGGGQQGGGQQGGGEQGGDQQGGSAQSGGGSSGDQQLLERERQGASEGGASQGGGDSMAGGRGLRQLEREVSEQAAGGGQSGGGQAGAGQSAGGQTSGGSAGGNSGGGSTYGSGHIERELDDPTELDAARTAARVRLSQTSEGATAAQIIAGAADGGFATTPYRQVYQDYARIVEEVIERETIPGGYRFYVRQYFELIAPRD